ncbi:MAG: phosphotransferase family protein [Solirubrobacterales bacterium]|nr:phosphotransferase family protein [Solirubrobacterales bacterium]
MSQPEGIDAERVEGWFAGHVPGARPPLRFERITGGRSNLTYRVTDEAGGAWALRRPPLSGGLGSAHDMSREYRIISALTNTDVPVPRATGFCGDESVNGSDFYVMDFVEGTVVRDADAAHVAFPQGERRRIGEYVVDALVAIHAVDPDEAGLGELGRRDGYVARQLRRWKGQWDASKTRELPAMDETHSRLSGRVPGQQGMSIVHGDFRLDNTILTADGEIAAVVDWELSTLGDPLADLGLLLVYWAEPGDQVVPLANAPTLAPGFPSRSDMAARYALKTGRDLSELDFYVALGYWKLAAILEGVYARYSSGSYGETADDFRQFEVVVEQLADAAAESAARLG